jgi:hypothetical protein
MIITMRCAVNLLTHTHRVVDDFVQFPLLIQQSSSSFRCHFLFCRDKTSAKNRRCKVIYSYKENKDDELTLAVGDLIEVYEEVSVKVSFELIQKYFHSSFKINF